MSPSCVKYSIKSCLDTRLCLRHVSHIVASSHAAAHPRPLRILRPRPSLLRLSNLLAPRHEAWGGGRTRQTREEHGRVWCDSASARMPSSEDAGGGCHGQLRCRLARRKDVGTSRVQIITAPHTCWCRSHAAAKRGAFSSSSGDLFCIHFKTMYPTHTLSLGAADTLDDPLQLRVTQPMPCARPLPCPHVAARRLPPRHGLRQGR